MTQFQVLAILTPILAFVVMAAVALWANFQDRAVLSSPLPADQSHPLSRERMTPQKSEIRNALAADGDGR